MELNNTEQDVRHLSNLDSFQNSEEKITTYEHKSDVALTQVPPIKFRTEQTISTTRISPRKFNTTKTLNQDVDVLLKLSCATQKSIKDSQVQLTNPNNKIAEFLQQVQVMETEELTPEQKVKQTKYIWSEIQSIQKFSRFITSRVNEVDQKCKEFKTCEDKMKISCDILQKQISIQAGQIQNLEKLQELSKQNQEGVVSKINEKIQQETNSAQVSQQSLELKFQLMTTGFESLASRLQFYESENARVFRLINNQEESMQGFLTEQDLQIKFNMLKCEITNLILKDAKDKFALKDELKKLSVANQQNQNSFEIKLEQHMSSIISLTKHIEQQGDNLSLKLNKTEFDMLQEQVQGMPRTKEVVRLRDEMVKTTKESRIEMQNYRYQIEEQKQIIGRYDEILCQKVSKHSLEIVKDDFIKVIADLKQEVTLEKIKTEEVKGNLQQIQSQLDDSFIESGQQAKLLVKLKSLLNVVDMFDKKVEQLNRTDKMKVTLEDFEKYINLKANKIDLQNQQNHLKSLQTNLQTFGVILQESFMLHQQRADETYQSKQNKVNHLIAHIQGSLKNMVIDFSQPFSNEISKEIFCQIHNALPLSSTKNNLRSARIKSSRNNQNYLSDKNKTSIQVQSMNEMMFEAQTSHKKSMIASSHALKHSSTTELFKKVSINDCPSSQSFKQAPYIVHSQVSNKKAVFKMLSSKHNVSRE